MWQELVTSQCSAIGLIIGIFTQSQAVMSQQALSHDYNSQHSMSATETNSNNPVELKKNGGERLKMMNLMPWIQKLTWLQALAHLPDAAESSDTNVAPDLTDFQQICMSYLI